ncbi:MAG: sigma-70 family RNA polymerase sigma factor [Xanthomonadales bacterium]|nr:sigma-70 family RNA polymerase sigma factor [Xanthomonadales bacterium]
MDTPPPAPAADPDALFAEVYRRLKAMASRQLAGHERGTLDTTAVVHELYLRMGARQGLAFAEQQQFFAYAARAMRHLLVDRARERLSQRAGGGWIATTLDAEDDGLAIASAEQALQLDAALAELERVDARAARVVELRYFSGLALEQVADMLGLARATVVRDWRFARSFLHDRID